MYTYYRVPWGLYNVTAEKEGHIWYAVFMLGPGGEIGTATHNIAIPDYAYLAPTIPVHSVLPTPTAVATATAIPTQSAKPSPGFEALAAIAGLIGVAGLTVRNRH
jgi:PGF-CTERM protein